MAQKRDPLAEQAVAAPGGAANEPALRLAAAQLVAAAKLALPDGLPASSPYAALTMDEVVTEAARFGIRLGPFMQADELRLVCEFARQQAMKPAPRPTREPMPPVPTQPVVPLKIRGLKPSPSNQWRVVITKNDGRQQVNVGRGQMTTFHNGTVVEARHYTPQVLQSFVDQGIKMLPIEEPEPEDD